MTHATQLTPENLVPSAVDCASWGQYVSGVMHDLRRKTTFLDDPQTRADALLYNASDLVSRPPDEYSYTGTGTATAPYSDRRLRRPQKPQTLHDLASTGRTLLKRDAIHTDRRGRDGAPRPPAVALCGTPLLNSDVRVWRSKDCRRVGLNGVTRCHNGHLCAECTPRRRAEALAEGASLIALNTARGGGFGYLTLTAAHRAGNDCEDHARRFFAAATALRGTPEWRRMAAAYGLTGTGGCPHYSWDGRNGHGWHWHGLLWFAAPVEPAALAIVQEDLRAAWVRCLRKRGLYAAHEYGLKLVVPDDPQRAWAYCVRNPGLDDALRGTPDPDPSKPRTTWGLLSTASAAIRAGRPEDAQREIETWVAYANAVQALRLAFVRFSPGLAARLAPPEEAPEPACDDPCDAWGCEPPEAAQEPGDDPCDAWPAPPDGESVTISRRDWLDLVLPRRAVPAVLDAMREGGPPAVLALIESLRPPPDPSPPPRPQGRVVVCLSTPAHRRINYA